MLIDSVNFQPKEFVTLMKGVIEKIHDGAAAKFIRQIDFDVTVKVRKKFLKKYAQTLENYLVNEFFGGTYPFKICATIQHNYAIFAVNYKLVEITALSMFDKPARKIFEMIGELTVDLNHNDTFLAAITDAVKDFADIAVLMRKLFQK